jgi:hypothetical protein
MASGKKIGAGLGLAIGVASFFHSPEIVTPADTAGLTDKSEFSVEMAPPFSDLDLNLFAKPYDADPDFNEFPWQVASGAGWIALTTVALAAAGSAVDKQTG